MNLPERFIDKICFEALTGCWIWTGSKTRSNEFGYGQFWDSSKGKTVLAHRFSYESIKGAIPVGLDVDHLCRNRACCNPDHLEPVCRGENMMRSPHFKDREVCPKGHVMTPENIVKNNRGAYKQYRSCRECRLIYGRWYQKNRRPSRARKKGAEHAE